MSLLQVPKKVGKTHRVSITLGSCSDASSCSKISCSSGVHLSQINFPPHVLSLDLVRQIFE